jgi:hypothetical protein
VTIRRKTPRTPLGDRLRMFAAGYEKVGQTERAEGLIQGADAVDEFFESQKLTGDDPMGALREAAALITEAAADLASAAMTVGRTSPDLPSRPRPRGPLTPLLDDVPTKAETNGVHRGKLIGRDSKPAKGERRVLIAIAQHPDGVTREQLTVLTGYKRSTRDLYIQGLYRAGLAEPHHNAVGRIVATSAGVRELGSDLAPLPTGRALADYWLARLPTGERACLDHIIRGVRIDRDTLSDMTGYKRSTRDLYVQLLRRRELVKIDDDGYLRPSEHLR